MSKPFTIRYLSTAERDLNDIFTHIMKDNPLAAHSQLEKFEKSISKLASNLLLGVTPKDPRLKKLEYQMLIVGTYLIFYVVKNKTVQIRRIIHGTRQHSFLL